MDKCTVDLSGEDPLPETRSQEALVRREPVTPETGCHLAAHVPIVSGTHDCVNGSRRTPRPKCPSESEGDQEPTDQWDLRTTSI